MYPLVGNERARQDLAAPFEQYNLVANKGKMIAHKVLPPHNVRLAHGTYPVVPLKQLMSRVDTAAARPVGYALARSPRTAYHRADLGFTQASYTTEEHGLEGTVDRNESVHYASHFNHEQSTAVKTLHDVLLERELRTRAALFNTTLFVPGGPPGQSQDAGTYQKDLAVGGTPVPWSDSANADPILDVFVSKTKVWLKFGCYPDCMVINEETLRELRLCEKIRQEWIALGAGSRAHQQMLSVFDHSLEQTGNMSVAQSAIAEVLDLREIIVGAAVLDANDSNDATFSASHVWGGDALVFKRIEGTGGDAIREIGLGHTLTWTPDTNNDPNVTVTSHNMQHTAGFFVEDYWDSTVRGQIIRVRHQDRQLIKYAIGELITNVL